MIKVVFLLIVVLHMYCCTYLLIFRKEGKLINKGEMAETNIFVLQYSHTMHDYFTLCLLV